MEEGMYELQDYVPGYGYLRIDADGENFVRVAPWDSVGGRRRRKTKKLMRRARRTYKRKNDHL